MRRSAAGVCAALLALVPVACLQQAGPGAQPPPDRPVWVAGDSLAHATAANMVSAPYRAGVGSAGFTARATSDILLNTLVRMETNSATPELVLAVGGVNDISRNVSPQQVIDGMVLLEQELQSRGVEVRWVLEPRWTHVALDTVNDWLLAERPNSIDCRSLAGPSDDGVHMRSYTAFAACVDAEVTPPA